MSLEDKIVTMASAIGSDVKGLIEGKVDKVSGKGLSDTNFTQAEKTKLAGVAAGATKNRADSENADKEHSHAISDVIGLLTHLNDIYERFGNVEYELFIRTLFMRGEKGFWADPSVTSTLFQNSDGTVVVADGDPIGLVLDKSGNNYNLSQTVSASRPSLLDGVIVFDREDDALTLDVPAGGITGTLFLATTQGTASYGVSMPAGVWTLGGMMNPLGDVVSAVLIDRVLSEEEKARLHVFGVSKGGTEFVLVTSLAYAFLMWTHLVDFPLIDTSNVEVFGGAWASCTGLTSFPLIDTSSGTNFYGAWNNCSGLTSFPLIDTSNGTEFSSTWYGCSGLTSFPLLDVSNGISFASAWSNCSGLTTLPLLDTSSGTDFTYAWQSCTGLTSFPLLDTSGGTSFYYAWRYCSGLTTLPLLDTSSGTEFSYAWDSCSGLTSFPELDVSNGTRFIRTWYGCSALTSFPLLDVSSGRDFFQTWYGCRELTTFPANFFDNCLATNFPRAFYNTNLSQESIDGILVSINSNGRSNGKFDQTGGSAPSSVGRAAIDAMRSRGWTVTVTGKY